MSLIPWLQDRIRFPLPGWRAQILFQPELSYGRHFAPPPPTARHAAVLVVLYPLEGEWAIPLTLRPAELLDHASQISLPGGVIEPGERSEAAAERELQEELGVIPDDLQMIGQLSPLYLFNSNFAVAPWLAATRSRPAWQPNRSEVAELIEAPLEELRAEESRIEWTRDVEGIKSRVPAICCRQHCVWGATCMILAELLSLVEEYRLQHL